MRHVAWSRFVLGLVAILVAPGATSAAATGTALYCGTKHVGTFAYGSEVQTLDGEGLGHVVQHGDIVRAGDDLTPFDNGYARLRPGGVWYVNSFGRRVTTIGTVERQSARRWDAYLGLGSRATRVGFALGSNAALGAVGLLLVDGLPCSY